MQKKAYLGLTLMVLLAGITLSGVSTDASVLARSSDSYDLSWWTMDAGAHVIGGGEYVLMGTTGQPDAGPVLSDGEYTLQGGFWPDFYP